MTKPDTGGRGEGRRALPWEKAKCRVPMWMSGSPAGFCGDEAFGHQLPQRILWNERGWRPVDTPYCFGHCCPNHGGPESGKPIVFQDGLTNEGRPMWCAVMPGFVNLQESEAAFSGDPLVAVASLRAALQSVEGGVQVAAKQESCPESAPRTETTVRDWRKSVFTYEHDDVAGHLYYFAPQTTAPGPYLTQRHVKAIVDIASDGRFAGVELIDNMPPLSSGVADTKSDGGVVADTPSDETATEVMAHPSPMGSRSCDEKTIACGVAGVAPGPSDQLTKTPSADHDDGNLRGLAEPNHQPHAVSQGWQPIETAPKDERILLGGFYASGNFDVEVGAWVFTHRRWPYIGDKFPTHWMPLPAPPSPAKTGGVG